MTSTPRAAAVLLAYLSAISSCPGQASWVQLQDGQPSGGVAMAYDSARGRVVACGGTSKTFVSVWEWDGVDWRQAATATAPPARTSAATAFDSRLGLGY